jgi:hypothetical protein
LSASKKPNCAIIALAEPSRQLQDSHTSVSGFIIRGDVLPKLILGVKFTNGLEVIAKASDFQTAIAAA